MGYETQDVKRFLVELDGDCNIMTDSLEMTDLLHWPQLHDWTTTPEGAVVWVTAWGKGPLGKPAGTLGLEWG